MKLFVIVNPPPQRLRRTGCLHGPRGRGGPGPAPPTGNIPLNLFLALIALPIAAIFVLLQIMCCKFFSCVDRADIDLGQQRSCCRQPRSPSVFVRFDTTVTSAAEPLFAARAAMRPSQPSACRVPMWYIPIWHIPMHIGSHRGTSGWRNRQRSFAFLQGLRLSPSRLSRAPA